MSLRSRMTPQDLRQALCQWPTFNVDEKSWGGPGNALVLSSTDIWGQYDPQKLQTEVRQTIGQMGLLKPTAT